MGAMLCSMETGTQEGWPRRSHLVRMRVGRVTTMARVIEFYIPEKFTRASGKWSSPEQCGKIIPFPAPETKSA